MSQPNEEDGVTIVIKGTNDKSRDQKRISDSQNSRSDSSSDHVPVSPASPIEESNVEQVFNPFHLDPTKQFLQFCQSKVGVILHEICEDTGPLAKKIRKRRSVDFSGVSPVKRRKFIKVTKNPPFHYYLILGWENCQFYYYFRNVCVAPKTGRDSEGEIGEDDYQVTVNSYTSFKIAKSYQVDKSVRFETPILIGKENKPTGFIAISEFKFLHYIDLKRFVYTIQVLQKTLKLVRAASQTRRKFYDPPNPSVKENSPQSKSFQPLQKKKLEEEVEGEEEEEDVKDESSRLSQEELQLEIEEFMDDEETRLFFQDESDFHFSNKEPEPKPNSARSQKIFDRESELFLQFSKIIVIPILKGREYPNHNKTFQLFTLHEFLKTDEEYVKKDNNIAGGPNNKGNNRKKKKSSSQRKEEDEGYSLKLYEYVKRVGIQHFIKELKILKYRKLKNNSERYLYGHFLQKSLFGETEINQRKRKMISFSLRLFELFFLNQELSNFDEAKTSRMFLNFKNLSRLVHKRINSHITKMKIKQKLKSTSELDALPPQSPLKAGTSPKSSKPKSLSLHKKNKKYSMDKNHFYISSFSYFYSAGSIFKYIKTIIIRCLVDDLVYWNAEFCRSNILNYLISSPNELEEVEVNTEFEVFFFRNLDRVKSLMEENKEEPSEFEVFKRILIMFNEKKKEESGVKNDFKFLNFDIFLQYYYFKQQEKKKMMESKTSKISKNFGFEILENILVMGGPRETWKGKGTESATEHPFDKLVKNCGFTIEDLEDPCAINDCVNIGKECTKKLEGRMKKLEKYLALRKCENSLAGPIIPLFADETAKKSAKEDHQATKDPTFGLVHAAKDDEKKRMEEEKEDEMMKFCSYVRLLKLKFLRSRVRRKQVEGIMKGRYCEFLKKNGNLNMTWKCRVFISCSSDLSKMRNVLFLKSRLSFADRICLEWSRDGFVKVRAANGSSGMGGLGQGLPKAEAGSSSAVGNNASLLSGGKDIKPLKRRTGSSLGKGYLVDEEIQIMDLDCPCCVLFEYTEFLKRFEFLTDKIVDFSLNNTFAFTQSEQEKAMKRKPTNPDPSTFQLTEKTNYDFITEILSSLNFPGFYPVLADYLKYLWKEDYFPENRLYDDDTHRGRGRLSGGGLGLFGNISSIISDNSSNQYDSESDSEEEILEKEIENFSLEKRNSQKVRKKKMDEKKCNKNKVVLKKERMRKYIRRIMEKKIPEFLFLDYTKEFFNDLKSGFRDFGVSSPGRDWEFTFYGGLDEISDCLECFMKEKADFPYHYPGYYQLLNGFKKSLMIKKYLE